MDVQCTHSFNLIGEYLPQELKTLIRIGVHVEGRISMVKIEWSDGLSVGVELVDNQHKELLSKMNDISHAIEHNHSAEAISKTLDFMMEYTDFHFGTEEKHMEVIRYPRIEYHKKMHEEFVDTLKRMTDDFLEDGATQELAESVNVFLFNWLVKHIKGVDGAFGNYLKEKGVTIE
jgi:hemerythrin